MEQEDSRTRGPRVRDLDGLRGLAAVAVLVAHLFGEPVHGVKGLSLGWLGVSIFFALSGYLIGGIILNDLGKPGFFKVFYARRAARILPVYFVVVLVTLGILTVVSGAPWADPVLHPAVYASFTTNIAITLGADGGKWLMPTWTLAVEEQFYLVLPILILVLPRRALPAVLIALCAFSLAFRAIVFPLNADAASLLLPSRWDTLLYGVLAAWLQRSVTLANHLGRIRLAVLGSVGLLVAVLASGSYALTAVASPALIGIATAGLILLAATDQNDTRFARLPVLTWFGSISYGLYLIHQPVNGLLHGLAFGIQPDVGSIPQVLVTIAAALLSIGLAWLSWRCFEKPILDRTRAWAASAPPVRAGTGVV